MCRAWRRSLAPGTMPPHVATIHCLVGDRRMASINAIRKVSTRARRFSLGSLASTVVAMRKIKVMLDENLVSRARHQDLGEADKSDDQVVEDARAVFLGLCALGEARAQGTLAADDADQLAGEEVRAVRRARSRA